MLVVQQPPPVVRADKRAFRRAVSLTRLIIHDLEVTLEARRVAGDLDAVRRPATTASFPSGARPPLAIRRVWRGQRAVASHTQQIVQQMLEYIHEHHSRPMGLGDVASAMRMNSAYLCELFSGTMGLTFHHYLEELRLARAKELLGNPVNRIGEVACAVGYANPNHFREVFKARVGIPPSVWRVTARP
jgi:AraC-like DNA-binding protein